MEVGNNVQAIFGTQADGLKSEIQAAIAQSPTVPTVAVAASAPTQAVDAGAAPAASAPLVVGTTTVLAPVRGTIVPLTSVPDQTFAQGLVGHGVAIDPPREVVEAVAPVSGKILQLWPHAYVIMTADKVGVLVHLGLDTVQLKGDGFTTHVAKGDQVEAGQTIVTFDVPAVEAGGRNPVIPVVVMDSKDADVSVTASGHVAALDDLFTVNR
jgi:PTS system N-acetylglucosamine-specific IIC component